MDHADSSQELLPDGAQWPWSGLEQLVFCVGLPKSGTHSLADMLAGWRRSAHEPGWQELLPLLPKVRAGELSTDRLGPFFVKRHHRLGLEFESSHLLGSFTPHLVEIFPRAQFVLLVRDCRSWIDSMINDQVNLTPAQVPVWRVAYDAYFDRSNRDFPKQERILKELDLYPLRNYVAYWHSEVKAITSCVPDERLLTLRTEELSSTLPAITNFFGLPADALSARHSYKSWRKHDILDRIDPAHISSVIEAGHPG